MCEKPNFFKRMALTAAYGAAVATAATVVKTHEAAKGIKKRMRPLEEQLYDLSIQGDKNIKRIKRLIKRGADVNYQCPKTGYTPLMCAAWMEPNCVKTLLDAGADPLIKNHKGETALDRAIKCEKQNRVSAMRELIEDAVKKKTAQPTIHPVPKK